MLIVLQTAFPSSLSVYQLTPSPACRSWKLVRPCNLTLGNHKLNRGILYWRILKITTNKEVHFRSKFNGHVKVSGFQFLVAHNFFPTASPNHHFFPHSNIKIKSSSFTPLFSRSEQVEERQKKTRHPVDTFPSIFLRGSGF